jgi:hypothetical protein
MKLEVSSLKESEVLDYLKLSLKTIRKKRIRRKLRTEDMNLRVLRLLHKLNKDPEQ